jgi:hypothetical protein
LRPREAGAPSTSPLTSKRQPRWSRRLDVLKAQADDAVIQAEMAQTYTDGALTRLSSSQSRFEHSVRAAQARSARRVARG